MNEDDKKTETEVTPEGAVEIQEEDLEKASGGAGYIKSPVDKYVENPTSPTLRPEQDPSLKQSPTLSPTDQDFVMKKL